MKNRMEKYKGQTPHLFLVRHHKRLWIHVAWQVVMMQKPVLCTPLDGHFLPAASTKNLSTPMQNCRFTGLYQRKKLLLKNCLTVQENGQHALEVWLHLSQLSWMAGGWLFHWDDCCFVPGSWSWTQLSSPALNLDWKSLPFWLLLLGLA